MRLRSPAGNSTTVKAGAVTKTCAMSQSSQNSLITAKVSGKFLESFGTQKLAREAASATVS